MATNMQNKNSCKLMCGKKTGAETSRVYCKTKSLLFSRLCLLFQLLAPFCFLDVSTKLKMIQFFLLCSIDNTQIKLNMKQYSIKMLLSNRQSCDRKTFQFTRGTVPCSDPSEYIQNKKRRTSFLLMSFTNLGIAISSPKMIFGIL